MAPPTTTTAERARRRQALVISTAELAQLQQRVDAFEAAEAENLASAAASYHHISTMASTRRQLGFDSSPPPAQMSPPQIRFPSPSPTRTIRHPMSRRIASSIYSEDSHDTPPRRTNTQYNESPLPATRHQNSANLLAPPTSNKMTYPRRASNDNRDESSRYMTEDQTEYDLDAPSVYDQTTNGGNESLYVEEYNNNFDMDGPSMHNQTTNGGNQSLFVEDGSFVDDLDDTTIGDRPDSQITLRYNMYEGVENHPTGYHPAPPRIVDRDSNRFAHHNVMSEYMDDQPVRYNTHGNLRNEMAGDMGAHPAAYNNRADYDNGMDDEMDGQAADYDVTRDSVASTVRAYNYFGLDEFPAVTGRNEYIDNYIQRQSRDEQLSANIASRPVMYNEPRPTAASIMDEFYPKDDPSLQSRNLQRKAHGARTRDFHDVAREKREKHEREVEELSARVPRSRPDDFRWTRTRDPRYEPKEVQAAMRAETVVTVRDHDSARGTNMPISDVPPPPVAPRAYRTAPAPSLGPTAYLGPRKIPIIGRNDDGCFELPPAAAYGYKPINQRVVSTMPEYRPAPNEPNDDEIFREQQLRREQGGFVPLEKPYPPGQPATSWMKTSGQHRTQPASQPAVQPTVESDSEEEEPYNHADHTLGFDILNDEFAARREAVMAKYNTRSASEERRMAEFGESPETIAAMRAAAARQRPRGDSECLEGPSVFCSDTARARQKAEQTIREMAERQRAEQDRDAETLVGSELGGSTTTVDSKKAGRMRAALNNVKSKADKLKFWKK